MTEAVSVRAKGAGMMAGAAVMALYALGFVAAAGSGRARPGVPGVGRQPDRGCPCSSRSPSCSPSLGRNALKNAPTAPEQTQETLKEDARWARQQIAKSSSR